MPMFGFAWVAEGTGWTSALHREDEKIVELEISQEEGEFPVLRIQLENPGVGLLAAGRNQWCWVSWDDGSGPIAMFTGRLVGIPARMQNSVVELMFVARPPDWQAQRETLASSMRDLPWFDPVWLAERVSDPDVVLETRKARWHWHRTTLALTTSDITEGEAGTITVDDAIFEDTDVSFGEVPLKGIDISLTVQWPQTGAGEVIVTYALWNAFTEAGSPWPYPSVGTLTGDGLLSSWPDPGQEIGGGWSVSTGSSIIDSSAWLEEKANVVWYTDKAEFEGDQTTQSPTLEQWASRPTTLGPRPTISTTGFLIADLATWEFAQPLSSYMIDLRFAYAAERNRSEIVTCHLDADLQPLVVDPGASERETLELSSSAVGEPIDAAAGSPTDLYMPIGDLRKNSYFKTDRGAQSFENALLLARAKLYARARAVQVEFTTSWANVAADISCRHSVRLIDARLPGGEAAGKVTRYSLLVEGGGRMDASVTIGCTIGRGNALAAPAAGDPVYVEDGVLEDGIQARIGAEAAVAGGDLTGELHYQTFDDFEVYDDDGVDLFNMTVANCVTTLTVTNGPDDQKAAINASIATTAPDPVGALKAVPTTVQFDLVPVVGGDFLVEFMPAVSALVIPQTIDLEAA